MGEIGIDAAPVQVLAVVARGNHIIFWVAIAEFKAKVRFVPEIEQREACELVRLYGEKIHATSISTIADGLILNSGLFMLCAIAGNLTGK